MALDEANHKRMADQARLMVDYGAPGTARIVQAMLSLQNGATRCGARIANWTGHVINDALPLRLAGGLHFLHLTGKETRLAPVYASELTDQEDIDRLVANIVADHDEFLLPWFEGPPQTNEAGRSSAFMAALIWLSPRLGPRFELNEIGSSGGLNLLMDRYRFQLGDVVAGPADSALVIAPEWRGAPLTDAPVEIVKTRGCDLNPIDLTDDLAANKLRSYAWPEMTERTERLDKAIAILRQCPPDLVQADAADWVEQLLLQPHEAGVTRVLMHSIVWQYLPDDCKARIEAAMAAAGPGSTAQRPLAWIASEVDPTRFRPEIRVRYWAGKNRFDAVVGTTHAHGYWLNWRGDI